MNEADPIAAFDIAFFGLWGVLVIANAAFFRGSRNSQLKRRVVPWAMAVGVGLFLCYLLMKGASFGTICGFVIIVPLIMLICIRTIKFCDVCGATIRNPSLFPPTNFCPECGSPLKANTDRHGEDPWPTDPR